MNNVCITGKLCRGGEFKQNDNNKSYYRGSLAYWNSFRKETEFFKFVIFGQKAFYFNEWSQAGDPIGLVGRLQTSKWTDKNTQVERSDISIAVGDFDILKPREKADSEDSGRPDDKDFPEPPVDDNGALPF